MSDEKNPTHQDLVRIEKHPGYYMNPVSKKITFRRQMKGRSVKIHTGKTKIGEAKQFVEMELERIRGGKSDLQIKREMTGVSNPLIDDIWTELLEVKEVGKEKATKQNYAKAWTHGISGFWSGKTRRDLNSSNIAAYKAWYLETHPERMFRQTFEHFKMLTRFMFQRKYLADLPDLSELEGIEEIVKKNKKYKKPGRVYTDDEQLALLGAWKEMLGGRMNGTDQQTKTILAARARLGIKLGLERGMREKEICQLRKEKVDFELGKLEAWSFKNHKWRDIPLDPSMVEAIQFQYEANAHLESPWVFPKPSNPSEPITQQMFEKVWYRARAIAGVVPRRKYDARFHDCRKTFATITARVGWPPKAACEILDMSLDVYANTYANDIGLETKALLIGKLFGGRHE